MRTFKCVACDTTYYTNTTKEIIEDEFIKLYKHKSNESKESLHSVCDTCYEIALPYINDN